MADTRLETPVRYALWRRIPDELAEIVKRIFQSLHKGVTVVHNTPSPLSFMAGRLLTTVRAPIASVSLHSHESFYQVTHTKKNLQITCHCKILMTERP